MKLAPLPTNKVVHLCCVNAVHLVEDIQHTATDIKSDNSLLFSYSFSDWNAAENVLVKLNDDNTIARCETELSVMTRKVTIIRYWLFCASHENSAVVMRKKSNSVYRSLFVALDIFGKLYNQPLQRRFAQRFTFGLTGLDNVILIKFATCILLTATS